MIDMRVQTSDSASAGVSDRGRERGTASCIRMCDNMSLLLTFIHMRLSHRIVVVDAACLTAVELLEHQCPHLVEPKTDEIVVPVSLHHFSRCDGGYGFHRGNYNDNIPVRV